MQRLKMALVACREFAGQTLQSHKWRKLISASESPRGYVAIAGVGVGLVILGQIGVFNAATLPSPSAQPQFLQTESPEITPLVSATDNTDIKTPQAIPSAPVTEELTLKRGETLIELLTRSKIASRNAHSMVAALRDVANLRRLQAGQHFNLRRSADDPTAIDAFWYRDAFDSEAHAFVQDGTFKAEHKEVPTLSLTHLVEGVIDDNLYLSAREAGLPDSVIIELIRMLSFEVDFEREIRSGDTFSVYYKRRYAPTYRDTENGAILHVDLGLNQNPVSATLFETAEGEQDYFRPNGESTRRALMKTPLDKTVVTSSYGTRKHPVLGYTRAHKGVDFRARTGTPIMAAGDGVIEIAARNGSYGNYIRIRHNDTYKTAYAHLSKYGRGIKKGMRVKQGQVIGYAGATGRVTAAHLHYEVLQNGKQINPLALKLPTGKTLKGDDLNRFQEQYGFMVADIGRIREQGAILAEGAASGITAAR